METLTGHLIGLGLTAAGSLIAYGSILKLGLPHEPMAAWVVWPLVISLFAKLGLAAMKFRQGRKLISSALLADAWNDAMDTLSAVVALSAIGLTLPRSGEFFDADRYGGFAVGLIVIGFGCGWRTRRRCN